MTGPSPKQWMLGLPGHKEVVRLEDVVLLVKGGQLRPTDLVKKLGEPWRAANEIPELVDHFAAPQRPIPPPVLAPEAAAPPPPRPAEPVRPTTARVARAEPPKAPVPSEPPRVQTARLTRFTERRTTSSVPPAAAPEPPAQASSKAAATDDKRPPEPSLPAAAAPSTPAPAAVAPKAEPKPAEARRLQTRPVPKPPPKPVRRLEPMVAKYFSPVDLLRSASFAFDPRKLLLAAAATVPLLTVWALLMFLSGSMQTRGEKAMAVIAMVGLIFGFALALTALAYVTRRQLEGSEKPLNGVLDFTRVNLKTALAYPVVVLFPSLVSLGVLWLLGLVRNSSSTGASALKVLYIFPMLLAFLAVLGAFVYQLASMYVPAVAAIEGTDLGGSVRAAWSNVRRQWGRVVLHWLIVTVAFGVIAAVCVGLAWLAIKLPEFVFGDPGDAARGVESAWASFVGLFALYRGLALGLGMTLPISLFSTLGTLSYMSLRHPASAPLSPAPMEETSGISIRPAGGAPTPMEATHPAETRPAPDSSRPGPALTPPPPEVSDDSDEQPLAKD